MKLFDAHLLMEKGECCLFNSDPGRIGLQWHWTQQGIECSHAGPPDRECTTLHEAVCGAHYVSVGTQAQGPRPQPCCHCLCPHCHWGLGTGSNVLLAFDFLILFCSLYSDPQVLHCSSFLLLSFIVLSPLLGGHHNPSVPHVLYCFSVPRVLNCLSSAPLVLTCLSSVPLVLNCLSSVPLVLYYLQFLLFLIFIF